MFYLQQVDVVRVQPLERLVDRLDDVFPVDAGALPIVP